VVNRSLTFASIMTENIGHLHVWGAVVLSD